MEADDAHDFILQNVIAQMINHIIKMTLFIYKKGNNFTGLE